MKIKEQDVYKKISVRAPYFALQNIEKIGNKFVAKIPIEQPLNSELGIIGTGEIARHLAILGAIALGFSYNETNDFYYDLAYYAEYNRTGEIQSKQLKGVATCNLENKREGVAFTKLITDTNEEVANLLVRYYLLPRKIFERQFKDKWRDLRKNDRATVCHLNNQFRDNIYSKMLEFVSLKVTKTEAIACIDNLSPYLCMGHFPLYPAFPVAFASSIKTYLCGLVLRNIFSDNINFFAKNSIVNAYKLAFAGSSIKIVARLIDVQKDEFIFNTETIDNTNNEVIMNLKFTIKTL